MSKSDTDDDFIEQVKNGKYGSKVNAQRAIGIWTRHNKFKSAAEKKKAVDFVESYFKGGETPAPAAAAKPAKKSKKVAKKKASKKVAARAEAAPAEEKEAKPAKKVTRKAAASAEPPQGTLPLSPNEASSVANVLAIIDSTVNNSVSIINALKAADELSKTGDINKGVEVVKQALVNAAHLLNQSVVAPLHKSITPQADPEVTARLEQVVNAVTTDPAAQGVELPPYMPPQGQPS